MISFAGMIHTPVHPRRVVVLDLIEKYAFLVVFTFLAVRMYRGYEMTGHPAPLVFLADQAVILLFLLLRRPPKDLSLKPGDWFAGVLGTLLPACMEAPEGEGFAGESLVLVLLAIGFTVHVSAKLTLRRSFGIVAANRGIKLSGAYRFVRHPMYLGYMISHVGLLLAGPTLVNLAVVASAWALFLWRIVAEERVLAVDADYAALRAHTRWRLLPGLY